MKFTSPAVRITIRVLLSDRLLDSRIEPPNRALLEISQSRRNAPHFHSQKCGTFHFTAHRYPRSSAARTIFPGIPGFCSGLADDFSCSQRDVADLPPRRAA